MPEKTSEVFLQLCSLILTEEAQITIKTEGLIFYCDYFFFFPLSNRNRKYSGDNGWLSKRNRDIGTSTKRDSCKNEYCCWHATRAGVY